jgi:hypothetical protein
MITADLASATGLAGLELTVPSKSGLLGRHLGAVKGFNGCMGILQLRGGSANPCVKTKLTNPTTQNLYVFL